MRFYRCRGNNNVAVSRDGATASRRRLRDFNNGVVFGDRPLRVGVGVTLRVVQLDDDWSGGLKVGVVATRPSRLTSTPGTCLAVEGDSWILLGDSVLHNGLVRAREFGPNLDDLKRGDRVSLVRTDQNQLLVSINDVVLGHAASNLPDKVYLVAELYGKCVSVELSEQEGEGQEGGLEAEGGALAGLGFTGRRHGTYDDDDKVNEDNKDRLRFHRCRGSNVVLSSGRLVAARRGADRDYANGVVLTDRPLRTDEMFMVQIVRQVTRWTGNIEIGVCSRDPATLVNELPSTMTKLSAGGVVMLSSSSVLIDGRNGVVDYSSVDLDELKEGDTVGVVVDGRDGHVHFWIGGVDQGPAFAVADHVRFWGVVDMFGKTSEVQIVRSPSSHPANANANAASHRSLLVRPNNGLLLPSTMTMTRMRARASAGARTRASARPARTRGMLRRVRRSEELLRDELAQLGRRPDLIAAGSGGCDFPSTDDDDDDDEEQDEEEEGRGQDEDEDEDEDYAVDSFPESVKFDTVIRGPNVVVTSTGRTAFRPWPEHQFNQALVVSASPLEMGRMFCIRVDRVEHKWIGCMEIGLMGADPKSFSPPWPHSLSDVNGDVWMLSGCVLSRNGSTVNSSYRLDLDALDEGSRVGLLLDSTSSVKFFLDGRDQGVAFTGLPPNVWVGIDLYGKCSKISVANPETPSVFVDLLAMNGGATIDGRRRRPRRVPQSNGARAVDPFEEDCSDYSSEETERRSMLRVIDSLPALENGTVGTLPHPLQRFHFGHEDDEEQGQEQEEEEEDDDDSDSNFQGLFGDYSNFGNARFCAWDTLLAPPPPPALALESAPPEFRLGSSCVFDDSRCGANVVLSEDRLRAKRCRSFNHGLVFSKHGLDVGGRPFCFRIEKVDPRWPGTLRVGVVRKYLDSSATGSGPLPPDMASLSMSGARWTDGYSLMHGPNNVLLAPFGESLLRPIVGMVVAVSSNSNGVYLAVDGRSVGALTLDRASSSASVFVVVVDLFGPLVEVRLMPTADNNDAGGEGKGDAYEPSFEPMSTAGVDAEDPVPTPRDAWGMMRLARVPDGDGNDDDDDKVAIVDDGQRAFRFAATGRGGGGQKSASWVVCSRPVVANMPVEIEIDAVDHGVSKSSLTLGCVRCDSGGDRRDFRALVGLLNRRRCPVGALLMTDAAVTVFKDRMLQPACLNFHFPPMPASLEQLKAGDSVVVVLDDDGFLYLFVNNRTTGRSLLPVCPTMSDDDDDDYDDAHRQESRGKSRRVHNLDRLLSLPSCSLSCPPPPAPAPMSPDIEWAADEREKREGGGGGITPVLPQFVLLINLGGSCTQISLRNQDQDQHQSPVKQQSGEAAEKLVVTSL